MRTENYKHGVVSILLVSALVFSMVTIAAPLASAGQPIVNPGGSTIEVAQGGTFTIRYVLEWNESGYDGAYSITMAWYCYGNHENENLTFESASAYFTSDSSSIAAQSTLETTPGENTKYALTVECPTDQKESRDEQFNVDIVMGAYGVDGDGNKVPHIPGDHMILKSGQGIIIIEEEMPFWNVDPITIRVIKAGVTVDITPPSITEGWAGETLNYEVEVTNTGARADTYTLSATDDASWLLSIPTEPLQISANSSDTVTLTVTVGSCNGCTDNIIVAAVGDDASDSDTCTATQKTGLNVDISISPSLDEAEPGEILYYDVVIKNTGTEDDNYDITIGETEDWGPHFSTETIYPSDDTDVASQSPDSNFGTSVEIRSYSFYIPGVFDDRAIGYVKFNLGIIPPGSIITAATLRIYGHGEGPSMGLYEVSFDDSWSEMDLTWNSTDGFNGLGDLITTVSTPSGFAWWEPDITEYIISQFVPSDGIASIGFYPSEEMCGPYMHSKESGVKPELVVDYEPGICYTEPPILPGENVTRQLTVPIPENAVPGTTNVITVTATSQCDENVRDSGTCEAYVKPALRGVEATIVPPEQETYKDPLTYVVEIRNTGVIADKYDLTATSPLGWPVYIEPQMIYLKPDHSAQAALSVTIPYQTLGGTEDVITVDIQGNLASGSTTDPVDVSTSVSCIARAKEIWGVDLEVYPSIHQTGHPDSPLTWLVTVTNTGNMPDVYTLDFSQFVHDVVGTYPDWTGGLSETTVPLDAYEEASILLTLTVPDTDDMRTGVHNDITVVATGVASDTASVTAQVLEQKPRIPQGEIKLQAVAGIVAIDVWETYYDFGVLNEEDFAETLADYFTVRNVGNVDVTVSIVGTDAVSKPGEPAAEWTLADGIIGVDTYAMWRTEGGVDVDTVTNEAKILTDLLVPSDETSFDLKVQAPSTFTTPAKMWMKVLLTARQKF